MIYAHLVASLRETFPARASEWALAAILFLWSLILHLNADLFGTGATYKALAEIMTQPTWALLCLITGGGRLLVLAINGSWRRTPHWRGFTAVLSCLFWFLISVGAMRGGTFGTALAVYPVLFLLDSYNAIRAFGEAGTSDANHSRRRADGTDT